MKRIIAWLTVVAVIVMHVFIPVSSTYASGVSLIESNYESTGSGKINVTGKVTNNIGESRSVGIIAIGYDANNKAIETKSSTSYTSKGSTRTATLMLDAGNQITRVEVLPAGGASDIELLSSADRNENGKVFVTGVVENGSLESQTVGIVATGYDINNKAIETKTASSYVSKGSIDSYSLILNAGSQITRVEVKAAGGSSDLELLSSADRLENGKVFVSGAIENGTILSRTYGIVAIGYDANNKAVETKLESSYVSKGSIATYSLILDAGSQITRVEVNAVGGASDIELLSSADRVDKGKVYVTGTIENGTTESRTIGLVAIGYDAKNVAIETKSVSSYLTKDSMKSYSLILNAGTQIKRVEMKAIGAAYDIKLHSSGVRKENGKVYVTGVVENGGMESKSIGIVAVGYDSKNKPIETKMANSYLSKGSIGSYALTLNAGSQISKVKITPTGNQYDIVLLSSGHYKQNGKMFVTGVVENGTAKSQSVALVITGYNSKNKVVQTKTVTNYISSGSTTNYSATLDKGNSITKVVVKVKPVNR